MELCWFFVFVFLLACLLCFDYSSVLWEFSDL